MKLLKFILIVLVLETGLLANDSGTLLIDQSLHSRTQNISLTGRLTVQKEISEPWIAYAHGGMVGYSTLPTPLFSDLGSLAYIGPGFGYKRGPLWMTVEGRYQRHFSEYAENPTDLDFVVLFIFEDYWDTYLEVLKPFYPFLETYSEITFSLANRKNIVNVSYARLGLGLALGKGLFWDVHLEPYVSIDRLGVYYNNVLEPKVGTRLQYAVDSFSLSVTLSEVWSRYYRFLDYAPEYGAGLNEGGLRLGLSLSIQT